MRTAGPNLTVLGVGLDVPIITRDKVAKAKPDPDVFWLPPELLNVPITSSVVVGDSVWDLLAPVALGRSASDSYPEDTAEKNWKAQAHIACTTILPICFGTLMS